MLSRVCVASAVSFAFASMLVGCVGDDTLGGGSPGVQGGSGPPPSSYEDATLPGQPETDDADVDASDAADATFPSDAGDASDAAKPDAANVDATANADAGDASDGA